MSHGKLGVKLASRVKVTVLVDDFVTERGFRRRALPAHGLSLFVEVELEEGAGRRYLLDGGPSLPILLHNARLLNVDLSAAEAAIAAMWSYHHIAALLALSQRGGLRLLLPPLPRAVGRREDLNGLSHLTPLNSPVYNERALIVAVREGLVAMVPCSVYGVEVALEALRESEKLYRRPVKVLIGGFNVSTLDAYGLRLLTKFVESRGAFVVPLHSTSLEAREKLCKRFEIDIPGVGARLAYP